MSTFTATPPLTAKAFVRTARIFLHPPPQHLFGGGVLPHIDYLRRWGLIGVLPRSCLHESTLRRL